MSIGRLILWGGVGYIGYKLLTKKPATYMPGDVDAVKLVEAAKAHLDPATNWEIAFQKTGAVTVTGKRNGTIVTPTQTFPNRTTALAWVSAMPATGKIAQVAYFTA